jgi:hypothetical protein
MLKTVTNLINASQIQTPITLPGDVTLSTGNLVIGTSGKGIDFSATPGTGTSELLADYEEGTWDAQVTDGTNNATMNAKTCRYTKIGRQVFVHGNVSTTSVVGLSGPIYISGLPFAIGTFSAGSIGYAAGFSITAGYAVTIGGNNGESRCYPQVWDVATGTTQMDTVEWTSDGTIVFSFTYTV